MSTRTESAAPSRVGRRVGYAIGALVNVALLVALNVWPGWDAVPFLTRTSSRCSAWSTCRWRWGS